MKTIKLAIVAILTMASAVSYAQNPSSQPVPLQDSSRMDQGKKLNSTPTPMPRTGAPSDDTLIRDQRTSNMNMDTTKWNGKKMDGMKKGRRKGGSGELDTTGTRRKNN
ncbi:hypothetical protein ACFP1I_06195 [Dyadobacter subterraneus]|uniref:Pentapeptide MXKDX repeat protein n=1 Tax=Dyadobacter subterraneus TaxID=2773304 RepID=A0ABR9WHA3_9BACT|nr:hypothetical protein [Dyadobacter subterraneus]MBE9464281.1 hypothetical protein [Dyadobacter subterraneus]